MDVHTILEKYYSGYDEEGRLLSRHGSVEYLTTMRYIEKYLRPGMRILEIGAGTGRYSHTLARQGYHVDAVELTAHNIEIFRQNTQSGESITVRQGTATDLSAFADESFDMTLLLGPMYHLFTEEEQKTALSEAVRVTKRGGFLFAAYCGNDATILQFCFGKGMLKDPRYKALVDPVTFRAASTPEDLFVLHRKEDIDALIRPLPLARLHYVGSDMMTNYMRPTVDSMDDELFNAYLDYHFATCERSDMTGLSNHILDILKKE